MEVRGSQRRGVGGAPRLAGPILRQYANRHGPRFQPSLLRDLYRLDSIVLSVLHLVGSLRDGVRILVDLRVPFRGIVKDSRGLPFSHVFSRYFPLLRVADRGNDQGSQHGAFSLIRPIGRRQDEHCRGNASIFSQHEFLGF